MKATIKKFGFDNRTFLQRINFAWQRFKNKLNNAYSLRLRELNEDKYQKKIITADINVNTKRIIEEVNLLNLYGRDVEFLEESFFRKIKEG